MDDTQEMFQPDVLGDPMYYDTRSVIEEAIQKAKGLAPQDPMTSAFDILLLQLIDSVSVLED